MENILFTTLKNATSQDPALTKQAEVNFAQWEKEQNFYPTILNFYVNRQLDDDVRYMAIITVKNGIDKQWRKNQDNAIKPDEKMQIKSLLLASFDEPQDRIAVQLAVVISKIARLDCPDDWSELMPILLERINSANDLEQRRTLQILVQVVKQLSSRRLHHDRIMFEQFTSNLFDYAANLWNGFTILYFQNVQSNAPVAICQSNLDKATMVLRILKKLVIYGFQRPSESPKPTSLIKSIFERIKDLLECRLRVKSAPFDYLPLLERHEKFLLKHMKVLTEFQEYHRHAFLNFAPEVLDFSFNYAFFEGSQFIFDGNKLSLPNFVIQCLNLIKGYLLNCNGNVYNSKPTEEESNLVENMKKFFTPERLGFIMDKLLMHYFLLTPADLEQWEDDPEDYVTDEGGDSWKYSLRCCTEAFFMALFQKYPTVMTKQLLLYIQKSQSLQLTETSEVNDILIKESIYNAVGLTAFHLFDDVDFDTWFTMQLLYELKIPGTQFKIVRKRILWVVAAWSAVKFSKSNRPLIYQACLEHLQSSEDMVVRLTASKTLKTVLEDFDFDAEHFLEFMEPSFNLLFHLLKEAKECDTKMNVLSVMSFIVEKMSLSMKIQADNLVGYLPRLWEEGSEHNMLRVAIISALLQIIKAIYELPETITPFVYNVIDLSTNVNDPSNVYLLEEGLELWLVVIHYSPTMNPALLRLCDNLMPIIEKSTMNLKNCLYIMQAYILLNPDLYLQKYGKEMIKVCQYLIKDIRTEGVILICKLFITIIKVHPEYAVELLHPVVIEVMRSILSDSDYLSVKQINLQVAVRYFLANQHAFSRILEEIQIENSFEKFLTIWFEAMPGVTCMEDKKLLALGTCSLLTVPNDVIMKQFNVIISDVFETLCDIMKSGGDDGKEFDSLILTEASELESNGMYDMEDYEYKTPHYERFRAVCLRDPVHSIVLKDYFQTQLIKLKDLIGFERYASLMSTVDVSIHKLLYDYVNTMVPLAE